MFKEFKRILKTDGNFRLFNRPPQKSKVPIQSCFKKRTAEVVWNNFKTAMHIIESPWSKILSILKKNGLGIDEIKDAEPIEEYREFFSIEY